MTTATVTQAGVEVLFKVRPTARVTQSGIEYLHRVQPGVRVTQSGIEYLHRVQNAVQITQSGAEVLYKSRACTTALAQIWTIAREDGEVFRFTSLDRDLPFGGHLYRACNSMTPSASDSVAEIGAAGSITLDGLVASGAVSLSDLHAGRFDGAAVEAWLVPWEGNESPRLLLHGTFGKVEYSENGFSADIVGDGAKLSQTPHVHPLGPDCRWKFGDPDTCGKDLAPLTVTGTIDVGAGQRGFTDADRAEAAGYFARGRITFTSGANAGVSAEIKDHSAGGVFTLWPRLPFPVTAGDAYSMTPGCTNLKIASGGTNGCAAWGNFSRYGGFLSVPGSDKVKKTPDVKKSL